MSHDNESGAQLRAAFMLEELRLAAIYLNLVENILTETESAARYLRQARHIMATIDRLLEQREFDPTREAEIVAERELLVRRLSRFGGNY
jgi:hypothetical protein